MTDIHRVFIEALQHLWGPDYWVAWPPGTKLALGDVGFVRDGRFTPTGPLSDYDFEIENAGARSELTYDSDGAVSVTFKGAGESPDGFHAIAAAELGARVCFGRERAVLAAYADVRETRIRMLRDLAEQLTSRFLARQWSSEDAVVTHLVRARSATILVGAGRESQAELRLGASAAVSGVSLGTLAVNASVAYRDRLGLAFTGLEVTPFFRLLRLRRSFTGRLQQQYGRGIADAPTRMPASVIEEAVSDPDRVVEEIDQMTSLEGPPP